MGFLFRASILAKSDPYNACKYSIKEHPHYMDCENCQNKSWCEKFALIEAEKLTSEGLTMAGDVLKSIKPKKKPLP